ncbi:hypothetical protein TU50_21655 [Bacillus wiedmannii]|nr:hypothetical protein TU50_21655 [Bacillus wiedmannii]
MDFQSIICNLVTSVIYTLLDIIVACAFKIRPRRDKVAATTINPITNIQIINPTLVIKQMPGKIINSNTSGE